VDKAALVEAFGRDPALRRAVEALLHPLVFHALGLFWREQERGNFPLAVAEIPLYPESGGEEREENGEVPVLVGVSCPFALRAKRLSRHRGWSAERIAGVESWQWPEEKKLRACDLVIANTGSLEHLKSAANSLLADLNRIAEEREKAVVLSLERIWESPG
jgi:23S rRNA pseudouridine1911/1915/1917 synthase